MWIIETFGILFSSDNVNHESDLSDDDLFLELFCLHENQQLGNRWFKRFYSSESPRFESSHQLEIVLLLLCCLELSD